MLVFRWRLLFRGLEQWQLIPCDRLIRNPASNFGAEPGVRDRRSGSQPAAPMGRLRQELPILPPNIHHRAQVPRQLGLRRTDSFDKVLVTFEFGGHLPPLIEREKKSQVLKTQQIITMSSKGWRKTRFQPV